MHALKRLARLKQVMDRRSQYGQLADPLPIYLQDAFWLLRWLIGDLLLR